MDIFGEDLGFWSNKSFEYLKIYNYSTTTPKVLFNSFEVLKKFCLFFRNGYPTA